MALCIADNHIIMVAHKVSLHCVSSVPSKSCIVETRPYVGSSVQPGLKMLGDMC